MSFCNNINNITAVFTDIVNEAVELQHQEKVPLVAIGIVMGPADSQMHSIVLNLNKEDIRSQAEEDNLHKLPTVPTLFPIGSISKSFGCTLVAIYVDRGLLNWHDPISKYTSVKLPLTLTTGSEIEITIHQLLQHINPLYEHSLTQLSEFGITREELWRKLQYVPVKHDLTTGGCLFEYSYQNVLFSMIADIVHRITGQSYEEYVRKELLIPLGMHHTTLTPSTYFATTGSHILALPHVTEEVDDECIPDIEADSKVNVVPYSPYWHTLGPPANVALSIEDLNLWMKFHLFGNTSILTTETLHNVHWCGISSIPAYSMGWWIADDHHTPEAKVLCHTGSVTGFEAATLLIPSLQCGISVCCNLAGSSLAYTLVNRFAEKLLGAPYDKFNCTELFWAERPVSALELKNTPYDQLVRKYSNDVLGEVSVYSHENNALYLQVGANQEYYGELSLVAYLATHKDLSNQCKVLASRGLYHFKIKWLGKLKVGGTVYYDDDRVSFAFDDNQGKATLLVFAESICSTVLTCSNL
jgi:CubicO group peptidase (beta-lactamase class C family)